MKIISFVSSLVTSYVCTGLPVGLRSARTPRGHGQLLVTARQGVVRDVPSVEDVVLQHEENIEGNGEKSQPELCWVPEQRPPVVIVVSYQEHLEHAEGAAREVQEDVPNAPPDSAFPAEVHESLGDVFDEGDAELDIWAVEQEVEPQDDGREGEYENDDDEHGDGRQDSETHLGDCLVASLDIEDWGDLMVSPAHFYLVYHTLNDGDGAGPHGVEREEHVIGLDRDDSSRVSLQVFLLHWAHPEQGNVIATVESEANDVQSNKVEVETNDAELKHLSMMSDIPVNIF